VLRRSPAPPARPLAPHGWGAVVVLLLGVLLTSLGLGIGLPYATKAGWSLLGVAGGLALVIGLLLLALAVAGLARSVRGWWRLVVPPLAVVVALGLVYVLAVPLAVTTVPPTEARLAPEAVGPDQREVRLPTRDGVELAASYVRSGNGAAVVLLHGSGSTRASVVDQAAVLAAHGYGVLLLDARGHGDSGGRAMDWGWHGDEDVAAAVTFLEVQPEVTRGRIAAVGLSMGGEEALGAAAADDRLRAVVAEGAVGRGAFDLGWLSDVYGWRGTVTEAVNGLQTWLVGLLSGAERPVALQEAVGAAGPVLLVTAGDRPDEQHAAEVLRRAAPDRVEVWVVPGSSHTGGLRTAPRDWEARVVGFLDEALS
jgi:uncharacterized protein